MPKQKEMTIAEKLRCVAHDSYIPPCDASKMPTSDEDEEYFQQLILLAEAAAKKGLYRVRVDGIFDRLTDYLRERLHDEGFTLEGETETVYFENGSNRRINSDYLSWARTT